MQENDPTKSLFYDRCPLFGDLRPIEEVVEDDRPEISKYLETVVEARSGLIYPFLPYKDPSLPAINYSIRDYSYFNKESYPDPKTVEERIGYPAALLKSLRLIYWRTGDIEMYLGISGDTAAENAAMLDEDSVLDVALETNGIGFVEKQRIDSKMVFRLFALKRAMSAISNALIYKKPFGERGFSQESYNAACIYLHRVKEIKARKEETEAKESLIEDLFTKQNQIEELIPINEAKHLERKRKSDKKQERDKKEELIYKSMRKELIRIARVCVSNKVDKGKFIIESAIKLDKSKTSYVKKTNERIVDYLAAAKDDNKLFSKNFRNVPDARAKLLKLSGKSILQYIKEDKKQIWNFKV